MGHEDLCLTKFLSLVNADYVVSWWPLVLLQARNMLFIHWPLGFAFDQTTNFCNLSNIYFACFRPVTPPVSVISPHMFYPTPSLIPIYLHCGGFCDCTAVSVHPGGGRGWADSLGPQVHPRYLFDFHCGRRSHDSDLRCSFWPFSVTPLPTVSLAFTSVVLLWPSIWVGTPTSATSLTISSVSIGIVTCPAVFDKTDVICSCLSTEGRMWTRSVADALAFLVKSNVDFYSI